MHESCLLTKRQFLKFLAASAAWTALGCRSRTIYDHDGVVRVAHPTDGMLSAGVNDYFNKTRHTSSYDSELVELLNETWVKEFGEPINKDITIEFTDDFLQTIYAGTFNPESKLIRIRKNLDPFGVLEVVAHEVAHEHALNNEYIPELVGYRIMATSVIHFPEFGEATNYSSFLIGHAIMTSTGSAFFKKERYGMARLMGLFALNRNEGSFNAALDDLKDNGEYFISLANNFVDDSNSQNPVTGVTYLSGDGVNFQLEEAYPYRWLVMSDLADVVNYQIVDLYVTRNPELDLAQKDNLQRRLNNLRRKYQKAGFADPHIIYPADYSTEGLFTSAATPASR